ncbi:hypothetical protein SAMN05444580_101327 [Rhodococcus tukisamuensis]|uniref:Uncharacterized protein n=1 Tax=Rhodococcus tukisamuensis TaxID=168276 RepID=A0A1G6MV22_9NOCA|nr:hypothetical protein SAMN05444580_101327 [Rhodococcus tukisamuensis]
MLSVIGPMAPGASRCGNVWCRVVTTGSQCETGAGVVLVSDQRDWVHRAERGRTPTGAAPLRSLAQCARLTAETTARSEAVVIEVATPTPHTTLLVPSGVVTAASTYAAALASSPADMACSL